MKNTLPGRVRFFQRQYLRREDFTDEQGYQLALSRRHNITHHSWGIVVGLDIAMEEELLVVRPGLAIDGYGRELLLRARKSIARDEFIRLGSNRLDVWLYYEADPSRPAQSGFVSCDQDSPEFYRFNETPRLAFERAGGSRVSRPKDVAPTLLNATTQLETSDDPLTVWPVYLGRVTYLPEEKDPLKQFVVDSSDRRYAGIVAQVVDHPGSATRVQLGSMAGSGKRKVGNNTYVYDTKTSTDFAIYVPTQDNASSATPQGSEVLLEPRFKIDVDDNVLLGDTNIHGSLQLVGGAVKFENSILNVPDAPTDPIMYRTTEGNGDELRIDLGTFDEAKNQKFVIGFTAEDGSFKPSITLQYATPPAGNEPLPLLTINGDLKLEGRILNKDLIERSLSSETVAALLASFQAGTIAAGGS